MNHFFLWLGTGSSNESLGKILLENLKSVDDVRNLRGRNWSLWFAAQANGLGAFRNDRIRPLIPGGGETGRNRRLLWFGHAWSASDGNQPPISILEKHSAEMSVARLIEKGRENCDGVYALIIIDELEKKIAIASDMLGSFHIYYRKLSDGIAVSNSSSLLAGLLPLSSLDPVGVQELCSNSVPNEDRSIWCEVKKLRAAEILNIDTHQTQVELTRHRPILQILNDIRGYEKDPLPRVYDSIEGVLDILQQSGGRGEEFRDLPWAVDLTGGNDSRALMAAIVAHQIKVASTVTGPSSDPDVQIGESLARKLKIKHFTRTPLGQVSFTQFMEALSLTDGEFDAFEYAGVVDVHRRHIRDQLQFSLNGSYCEVARGHAFRSGLPGMMFPNRISESLCHRSPLDLQNPAVIRWRYVLSLKFESSQLFSNAAHSETSDYFPQIFQRFMSYSHHLPQHAQLDLIHIDLRMERWLGRLLSSTNQLWPAISPWGFQSPLTSVLTTAPQWRRNGLLTRAFTFRFAPDLAHEPLYTGNPAMPFSLRHAYKFLPVVSYFAHRALTKVSAKLNLSDTQRSRSAMERQPEFCSTSEINSWINQPLLLDSGLFKPERLMPFLSMTRPQSDVDHRIWCRLVTIEAALRRQVTPANSDPHN